MNYIDISKQAPADPEARIQWRKENYKRIAVSPKLLLSGVSDSERLRRFVDLPKLFDLLKNKRLILPTLGKLIEGDPFECFAKKSFSHLRRDELEARAKELEEYTPESSRLPYFPPNLSAGEVLSFAFEQRHLRGSQFYTEIQQMTLDDLKDTIWYLERERLKENLVCSCWHEGTVESDAMWKIYASQLGVSINSSAARMKSSVKMIIPKIYAEQAQLKLAAVQYEDTDECQNIEPWLIKRKAFMHEKEVRLYCDVPFIFSPKFELEIELSTFIEEIVITPFIAAWQVAGIKGAIEALLKEAGVGQIVVRQSKHMRAPQLVWPPTARARSEDELKNLVRPIIEETQS
ncbi:MAG TPA: hypothetical protein VGM58_00030 [Verrucomicrobiae bacterium]|jgi:hypothetical protein